MAINLYKATKLLHNFRLNNSEISDVYRALFGARHVGAIEAEAFTPRAAIAKREQRLARDGRVAELWRTLKQELQRKLENTQAQIPVDKPPRCPPHLVPYYQALLGVLKETRSLVRNAETKALTHRDGPKTPAQFASMLRDRHGGGIFTRVIDSRSAEHAHVMGGAHWVDWVEDGARLHVEQIVQQVMNNAPSRLSHPPRPFHIPMTAVIQKRLDELNNTLHTAVEQTAAQIALLPRLESDPGNGSPGFVDPHQAFRLVVLRVAYERALKNLAEWPRQRLPVRPLDLAYTSHKALQWAASEIPTEALYGAAEPEMTRLAEKVVSTSAQAVQKGKAARASAAAKAKPRSPLAKKPGRKPKDATERNYEALATRLGREIL